MTTAFVLLFIGFLVVFFEFFLPGGILGVTGTLLIIASIVLFAMNTESVLAIVLYVAGCGIALTLLVRFALWRVSHGGSNFNVYLKEDQEGYYAARYDKSAIGKNGKVFTDLRPGGYIIVEGKKHSAISKSGYLSKGTKVKVIDGEEESLIVQQIEDN